MSHDEYDKSRVKIACSVTYSFSANKAEYRQLKTKVLSSS